MKLTQVLALPRLRLKLSRKLISQISDILSSILNLPAKFAIKMLEHPLIMLTLRHFNLG